MNLIQDAPNVVSEDGLRALLREGYSDGLTSFLTGLGIDVIAIPMAEGKTAINKLDYISR